MLIYRKKVSPESFWGNLKAVKTASRVGGD